MKDIITAIARYIYVVLKGLLLLLLNPWRFLHGGNSNYP